MDRKISKYKIPRWNLTKLTWMNGMAYCFLSKESQYYKEVNIPMIKYKIKAIAV